MNCKFCNAEIDDKRQFCNRSCSASFNNKNRIISQETKEKISKTLSDKAGKHKKYDLIINDFIQGFSIADICNRQSVTRRTVVKILNELNLYKTEKLNEHSICEIHNIPYTQSGNSERYRCKQCDRDRQQKSALELKTKSVEYKGGKCIECGYNKCLSALEFHHIDPLIKDFTISHFNARKQWEKVKLELDKCILLCSNCHRELHEQIRKEKL